MRIFYVRRGDDEHCYVSHGELSNTLLRICIWTCLLSHNYNYDTHFRQNYVRYQSLRVDSISLGSATKSAPQLVYNLKWQSISDIDYFPGCVVESRDLLSSHPARVALQIRIHNESNNSIQDK